MPGSLKTMPPFKETRVRGVADLHKGDQITVDRGDYKHHMIVIEDPTDLDEVSVIHYYNDTWPGAAGSCACSGKSGVPLATVRKDKIDISSDVRKGRVYRIDWSNETFSPDDTVRRARSKLGEGKYSPFTNNCEHFATWCKTGRHESPQIEAFLKETAKHVVREGGKTVIQVGAKSVTNEGIKQVAIEGTKTVMEETVKPYPYIAKAGYDVLTQMRNDPQFLLRQVLGKNNVAAVMLDPDWIDVAQHVIEESAKSVGSEGAKHVVREGTKTVMEETTKTVMTEGAKQIGREGTKTAMAKAGQDALMQMVHDPNFLTRQLLEKSHAMLDPALVDVAQHALKESSKQLAEEGSKTVMNEGAKSAAKEGTKQVAKEGGKTVVKDTANTALKESAKVTMKEGSKVAAKSGGKSLGNQIMEKQGALGIGITVAMESYEFWNRCSESKKKRGNWEISQSEYEKEIATHAVKGVANGTATIIGGTVGQMLIPVPVLGGMVGAMAGKAAVWLGGEALAELTK